MKRHCLACDSTHTKKNSHTHNGKQNHYCHACGRQFVSNPEQILISDAKRQRIRKGLSVAMEQKVQLWVVRTFVRKYTIRILQRVQRPVKVP